MLYVLQLVQIFAGILETSLGQRRMQNSNLSECEKADARMLFVFLFLKFSVLVLRNILEDKRHRKKRNNQQEAFAEDGYYGDGISDCCVRNPETCEAASNNAENEEKEGKPEMECITNSGERDVEDICDNAVSVDMTIVVSSNLDGSSDVPASGHKSAIAGCKVVMRVGAGPFLVTIPKWERVTILEELAVSAHVVWHGHRGYAKRASLQPCIPNKEFGRFLCATAWESRFEAVQKQLEDEQASCKQKLANAEVLIDYCRNLLSKDMSRKLWRQACEEGRVFVLAAMPDSSNAMSLRCFGQQRLTENLFLSYHQIRSWSQ